MLADKDIDETMAADWAAIREKHTVEIEEPPLEPVEEHEVAPEPETAQEPVKGAEPARDKDGKFVKQPKEIARSREPKTPSTEASSADAAATPAEGGSGASPNPSPSSAPNLERAPSSWKPAARAEYDKLPKDSLLRAEIHRREQDFSNGHNALLPDAQLGKGLRQVIEPYRMLIEAEGGTPERAVASLLRTAAIFRVGTAEQKLQAVAGIAQQYGIDLHVFGQPQGQQGQQPQPTQHQFRDPRVDQLLAQNQRAEAERQQRTQAEMESTVNRWMNEVDAQGNPTRPYISDVIGEMSALIPQIKEANPNLTNAQALEEAYNRAIWAHPEIRTLLQQQAASAAEAERRTVNQDRVRDARRAASVNVPRRASTPSPGKPGKMEDTIADTARELGLLT